ncbi:MAG TPA: transposase [Pirellulales bacterium]|nr:transposase [Pirellulales bacterium]
MSKSKAYRSTDVKNVVLDEVLSKAAPGRVTVGTDIGKFEIFAVLRFSDGTFLRPWKVKNPSELEYFVWLLQRLWKEHDVTVAMESTGTYGDALRSELTEVGLPVALVSGKAARDYAEIFDGVPSQHDRKDAAVVAELCALGKSRPWPYQTPKEEDAEMAYWVEKLDAQQRVQNLWTGHLEAHLARHWPELTPTDRAGFGDLAERGGALRWPRRDGGRSGGAPAVASLEPQRAQRGDHRGDCFF